MEDRVSNQDARLKREESILEADYQAAKRRLLREFRLLALTLGLFLVCLLLELILSAREHLRAFLLAMFLGLPGAVFAYFTIRVAMAWSEVRFQRRMWKTLAGIRSELKESGPR